MPNLPAHIGLAHQVARRLSHPTLDANIGAFLLGSTAPDVRAMTRGTREDYHFASLDFAAVGAGVRGLLEAHPHLRPSSDGHGPTRAFVAGYITHLVLDEVWIVDMYRPYFGNRRVFPDRDLGNVLDRALQLELDRRSREAVTAVLPDLRQAEIEVRVGFIPTAVIRSWREFVLERTEPEFTWERLRFMARRIAAGDEEHRAHGLADEFIKEMPNSLERLHRYVGRDEPADFRRRAIESLVVAVGEYVQ